MVDWPTVALSASGSLAGILLTVLLERRREDQRSREALERRTAAVEERLRMAELELVRYGPGARFFNDLVATRVKGRGGDRWR